MKYKIDCSRLFKCFYCGALLINRPDLVGTHPLSLWIKKTILVPKNLTDEYVIKLMDKRFKEYMEQREEKEIYEETDEYYDLKSQKNRTAMDEYKDCNNFEDDEDYYYDTWSFDK